MASGHPNPETHALNLKPDQTLQVWRGGLTREGIPHDDPVKGYPISRPVLGFQIGMLVTSGLQCLELGIRTLGFEAQELWGSVGGLSTARAFRLNAQTTRQSHASPHEPGTQRHACTHIADGSCKSELWQFPTSGMLQRLSSTRKSPGDAAAYGLHKLEHSNHR